MNQLETTHFGTPMGRRAVLRGGLAGSLVVMLGGAGWWATAGRGAPFRLTAQVMGTKAEVLIGDGGWQAAHLARAALAEIQEVERRMTRFDANSEVGRPNANPGRFFPVSPLTARVVETAQGISAATDGRFNPGLGALEELWGFFGAPSPARLPAPAAVAERLRATGPGALALRGETGAASLRVAPGAQADLGGIAKGFAVDRAVARLRAGGVGSALVNIGGDLYALGRHPGGRPWQVGVRHPRRPGRFLTVLSVSDIAVATSGDYENFYLAGGKRLHHLLEAASGRPAPFHQSVTVTAPTAMVADALATAAFTAPVPEAARMLRRTSPAGWLAVDGRGNPAGPLGG